MKTSIIAAILLVLAAPAFATGSTEWKKIIDTFETAHEHCGGYDGDSDNPRKEELKKICAVSHELEKKLRARGYCIQGHTARPVDPRCIMVR